MHTSRYTEAESRVDSRMRHRRSPKLDCLLARTFHSDSQAPGSARRALRSLNDSIDADLAEDVRLLVSELVTNSLRHTGSDSIDLEVWSSDEVVRVDVSDRGAGFDIDGPPRPGRASGWASSWSIASPIAGASRRTAAPGSGSSWSGAGVTARTCTKQRPSRGAAQATTAGGSAVTSGGVWRSLISSSWSTFSKKRSMSRGSKCLPRSARMVRMVSSRENALR